MTDPKQKHAATEKPTEGKVTFSMYCTARKVPPQRQAGMRAYTTTLTATLAEWDAIFQSY